MTSAELAREVFSIVEAKILGRPSPVEFEMAYQARMAIERIRFAIKQIDQSTQNKNLSFEAVLQLADALDRLESADHHFQKRFRSTSTGNAQEKRESYRGAPRQGDSDQNAA